MSTPLRSLLSLIDQSRPTPSNRLFTVVGIGGHGGSGKSTLARLIATSRSDVQIVPTDSFWNGGQFDLARLRTQVLDALLDGLDATYDEWDWAGGRLNGARTVTPSGVVIIEGVCALHEMFRPDLDVRVWIEAPYEVRLARGVERDGEDMRARWTDVWMPSEDAYVARDNPITCAQMIVDGTCPF